MVSILGGGPAGSAAAIAALRAGTAASIAEKSKFPRHKVCGEFFSPEIWLELERIGAWDAFLAASPARIQRMKLHFGTREKTSRLAEPAWGLSRYAFDALLLARARELGAKVRNESPPAELKGDPLVIATGRRLDTAARGRRLFGFKAHFEGPAGDAVELFFFDGCYVGVSPVENGRTNVCGLGPEDVLGRVEFDYDRLVRQSPALRMRLDPLTRSMKWLSTGPLRYDQTFHAEGAGYPAGDALSFVDPFTGSGLVSAVKTGALAGAAAASREPVTDYLVRCQKVLKSSFEAARVFRKAVDSGWAERLAGVIPGRVLFALTRPGK